MQAPHPRQAMGSPAKIVHTRRPKGQPHHDARLNVRIQHHRALVACRAGAYTG